MSWRVPPYTEAAIELERYVHDTWSVHGIIVAGSIVRGDPGPTSDLDVFVIHREPWRVRDQKRFNTVPVEMFVNPPDRVREYFVTQHAAARPSTAHMLSTGEVLGNADAVVVDLVREAREWMARPLEVTPQQLTALRYAAADTLDNARDVLDRDPAGARLQLAHAARLISEYAFWSRGQFLPHPKYLIAKLAEIDATAAAHVRMFTANTGVLAYRSVVALANHVLGVDTFFEWTSDRS